MNRQNSPMCSEFSQGHLQSDKTVRTVAMLPISIEEGDVSIFYLIDNQ